MTLNSKQKLPVDIYDEPYFMYIICHVFGVISYDWDSISSRCLCNISTILHMPTTENFLDVMWNLKLCRWIINKL